MLFKLIGHGDGQDIKQSAAERAPFSCWMILFFQAKIRLFVRDRTSPKPMPSVAQDTEGGECQREVFLCFCSEMVDSCCVIAIFGPLAPLSPSSF